MLVTRSFACRAREGLMAIGNDWVLVEQVLVVNLAVQGVLESGMFIALTSTSVNAMSQLTSTEAWS